MNETVTPIEQTTNNTIHDYQTRELNLFYVICEVIVAVLAVAGNALVIYVFKKERRLRRRTNYYIISLATADFLVGLLGIPFAILSSVGLPNNLHACLFTVSLLVVLCTISIFCLVAVSVDRYWAILHPMGYSRNVRTKTALVIISICWFAGLIVGFLPLMGWHQNRPSSVDCFFLSVMDYNYLVFLYFGTIITPALLLAAFYAHIYRVVLKQLRQIVVMNPGNGGKKNKNLSSGGMIRMLGVQQRNEVKSTQNLAIIVLFFMICWIPLYTINFIIAFYKDFKVNSTFMLLCIILSHLNSAGNPLLYAYHLKDFRAALKNFFCHLFHIHQSSCDQLPPRYYSNYSQSRAQYRNSCSTIDFQKKMIAESKVSSIIKNSAILASAPTGKINRSIWNIAEDSGRDSGSSQESLKDVDFNYPNKLLISRPATPYKLKIIQDMNQAQAYFDSSSLDDSDDVFMDDYIPCCKDTRETCLSNKVKLRETTTNHLHTISKSSPQLSKSIFLVECDSTRQVKNNEDQGNYLNVEPISPKQSRRLSPYRIVSNLFKNRIKLNRSLSDGGNQSNGLKNLKQGSITNDFYSVPM